MADPAAVHPGNALQLVQLSQLIDNIAEAAYKGLQGLSTTLPALSDEERKHALLLHLHSTRQRLLRLHVLIEWSNKAAATKEVGKILARTQSHADALRESADQLYYLNQELQSCCVPALDVHTARQVLETGSFQALPSAISDVCGPPKRTAQQRQTALRHMDFLLRKQLLQEVLPAGMRVHSIGSGHAKLTFKGYYTAVLTLAEAPEAQADPQGAPQQGVPSQGHPQQQQPGHPQQQQPGSDEPMDVDQQADEVTSGGLKAVSQDDQVGPHKEKYRWRLLSFDILPDFERTALTPEQQKGLQAELESQMWQAADIRAQHSLAAAQRAQQAQHGTDTAQSGPAQTAPEPVTSSSQQPVSARAESSHPSSSQGGESGRAPLENDNPNVSPGDPLGAPHPLQLLHNVLAGIAGRLVLHEVHTRLRKLLDEKGRWAKLLKLNAAAVLSNGIRCSFWLNIQTASPPDAVAEAREEDTGRPPRPRATPRPPSPPPALEFGLDLQGAVRVISVPELLEDSRAHVESEPVWFELDLKALNVQQLLLQAAGQHAVVQLEALHHALQQQTSLTTCGCTTHLLTPPNPAANLTGLVPLPSGPAQAGPVPARALPPSLVMNSRGTALLVVSVQLKTGFLRLAAMSGAEQNQDLLQRLKQQEIKLASLQKDMRFAPLEDPSLSRGAALSRALAQELSSLFFIIAQQACFAQLAAAAAQHGLTRSGLPQSLLSGYLERDPSAPRLDPASCLALAFPPTPLLQAPTHADACTPGINLGFQTSPAPTQSLAASQRQTFPLGSTLAASQAASQLHIPGQTKPIDSASAASHQQAPPSGAGQTAQTAQQPAAPPLQTLFSSRLKGSKGKSEGQLDRRPAALRFYLLAELKQKSGGAGWHCYLLTCRCTFRGVVQQVMSCTTVPSNLIPRDSSSQRAATIHGKRKQPASDTHNVFDMSDRLDSSPQGMQPQQTDQHQLQPDGRDQQQQLHQRLLTQQPQQLPQQPDGHDPRQQLHQQLPMQQPQQLPLQQQCPDNGQGSGVEFQAASAGWTADLGRVVAWCFSTLVEKHLLAELKVLGIPYTEELALQSSVTPGHAAQQAPHSNKRQKLSQRDAGQYALGLSNADGQQPSGDGQLQSGDGQHQSADGQHQSGNGQHQLGDGQHRSGDGQRQSGNGQHQLGDGQHQSDAAQRPRVVKVIRLHGINALCALDRKDEDSSEPGTVSINLPDSSSACGSWTAFVHSQLFARLSQSTFTHPSSPDPSPLPLSHDGVPSSRGQLVQKHPSGMLVISKLLQGGTATALLELITASGRTHTALKRMAQLMHGQQQHLLHMGAQQRTVGGQHRAVGAQQQGHEQGMAAAVIKSEPGPAMLRPLGSTPTAYNADRVKLEQQQLEQNVAPGLPVKAETGRHVVQDSSREQLGDAGRQRSQALAWHVIASGVVHVAKIGLMHAVLQVRPPPPWSASHAPISSGEVKQEVNQATADVEMQDADVSVPPQRVHSLVLTNQQEGAQQLPVTHRSPVSPPPYLTLHMRWQLTHHLAPVASSEVTLESQNRASPSEQASVGAAPLQLPNLPGSGAAALPPDAREGAAALPPHAKEGAANVPPEAREGAATVPPDARQGAANVSPNSREAAADPTGIVRPAVPTLRCCITPEPELPHAVLQSFQDMAEMEEEGLLLDALAITAQPLAIVAKAISPERCRAVGLQPSQLSVVCKRPPYLLQLRVQQVQRPTLVLSLSFLKGGVTFVGLSAAAAPLSQPMQNTAAAVALLSEQAGLPDKLRQSLSVKDVFLPQDVSKDLAGSSRFFALAFQHHVLAGVWVHNSSLSKVLSHLIKQSDT